MDAGTGKPPPRKAERECRQQKGRHARAGIEQVEGGEQHAGERGFLERGRAVARHKRAREHQQRGQHAGPGGEFVPARPGGHEQGQREQEREVEQRGGGVPAEREGEELQHAHAVREKQQAARVPFAQHQAERIAAGDFGGRGVHQVDEPEGRERAREEDAPHPRGGLKTFRGTGARGGEDERHGRSRDGDECAFARHVRPA